MRIDYRILLQEEDDAVREHCQLSMKRIRSMKTGGMRLPCGSYFKKTAAFIGQIEKLAEDRMQGNRDSTSLEQLRAENRALYQDILPGSYGRSYANPDYAMEQLEDGVEQLLSFLYTEIRADIVYAYEVRLTNITVLNELFLEVYNLSPLTWEDGADIPDKQAVQDALCQFVSDYSDLTVAWRVREGVDPGLSFATNIIMESNLNDLRYLYRYGEYVADSNPKLASPMNTLPQGTIDRMADTYTEGCRKGFEVIGRDLKEEKTVVVEFQLGFRRMIRGAAASFKIMGLEVVFYRATVESVNRRASEKRGYYGTPANRQYGYDRRYDSALYMGNAFKERKLAVLKAAYGEFREETSQCASPALVETFGKEGFTPVDKKAALELNAHQGELIVVYANGPRRIVSQYMPGGETSFTIITFPKPDIGPDFEEIFRETIELNTLDYRKCQRIQQYIIDALDEAVRVLITSGGDNETCMKVVLHPLGDRKRESNFENCVSDMNIPLGEVFTSPLLIGIEGLFHVNNVCVGDYQFKNPRIRFEDGKVTDYSCGNFTREREDTREETQGRALVKQVIIQGHEQLPLEEFAIDANTVAYIMAQKFGTGDKLPILITGKMGPHFAVEDTCYSFAGDSPMYNPGGKEVIARDSKISLPCRKDVSKAYFNCYTDITIPYSELGDIKAVREDGSEISIVYQGRFVLPKIQELDEALD